MFLSGYPPFGGKNNEVIFRNIVKKELSFEKEEFNAVSIPALDLISKLLDKDPEKRITLEDALNHEWFKVELTEEPVVDTEVIKRMVEFNQESLLVQKMKTTMANLMGDKHINSSMLNEKFMAIDTEHNGLIKSTDLIRVLTENGVPADDALIVSIKKIYMDDDHVQ